jgi:hypothetical protein
MTRKLSREEASVVVHVVCSESVTEHGTLKTVWFKREASRWVPLTSDHTQPSESAPGTIWEMSITASVQPGSWLLRVDSAPAPKRHSNPLEYLRRETRQLSRQVRRKYYRVQRDGSLVEGKPDPSEIENE